MAKKDKQKEKEKSGDQTVAINRRARYDYEIEDSFEAGLVLTGTEVKSLRAGDAQIAEGYAHLSNGPNGSPEAWLHNVHIAPYKEGNNFNVESRRKRKLLLRRDQLLRLQAGTQQKGYTLIPLKLYFTRGKAKMEIGLGKGRKSHDKRNAIADRELKKDIRRSVGE